jgi:hypothetical protein
MRSKYFDCQWLVGLPLRALLNCSCHIKRARAACTVGWCRWRCCRYCRCSSWWCRRCSCLGSCCWFDCSCRSTTVRQSSIGCLCDPRRDVKAIVWPHFWSTMLHRYLLRKVCSIWCLCDPRRNVKASACPHFWSTMLHSQRKQIFAKNMHSIGCLCDHRRNVKALAWPHF